MVNFQKWIEEITIRRINKKKNNIFRQVPS